MSLTDSVGGQQRVRSLTLDSHTQGTGKSGGVGSLEGHKLERSESSRDLGKPPRLDRRDSAPALLEKHRVENGHRERQFGLKFFGRPKIEGFGERYNKEIHGDKQVGPYRVVGDKSRGVEPGFIGKKTWKDSDTAKMSKEGHKFSVKADNWLRRELHPHSDKPRVRIEAGKILEKMDVGFRPGKDDIYHFLRSHPKEEARVLAELKKHPGIQHALIDHIQTSEPKFKKNHYVKLDYRETESSGTGASKKYTLPKSNAKSFGFGAIGKFFHQLCRRQTPDQINRDAMRESLANDLMKSFGIFAQKLKLVPTTYTDGTPKLLLDGTHMTGRNGEKFSDFEGAIKGKSPYGQLVKLDESGKPVKNERGHYEVDTSIKEMGRNKIFMLALGDRDAIGSSGGNKGRVGDEFAAIDPGHSLETGGQRLLERRDIHSDMSFDQPSKLAGKCYKNFTIFDQCPFSERMEGVRKLKELSRTGEDLQVFNDYAKEFRPGSEHGMDFSEQIGEMRTAYEARRDYIVNEVFAERLGVYDYDMSGVGDPGAQETAKKQTLDVLDTLEKITSEHSWMSGDIELQYPTVKNRTEWHVAEDGDNIKFSVPDPSPEATLRFEQFAKFSGLGDQYVVERGDDGSITLTVPKTSIGQAFTDVSLTNLRAFDADPASQLPIRLMETGLA